MNLKTKVDKVSKTPQVLDSENISFLRMKSLFNMLTWHLLLKGSFHQLNLT